MFMPPIIAYILGGICAVAATVLAFIFITPAKNYGKLNKFGKFLADVINFKSLLIDYILKALYILATVFYIVTGFFLLFSGYSFYGSFQSMALTGLIMLIGGPIVTRLIFELIMMFVILVRNTNEINKKMGNAPEAQQPEEPQPAYQQPAYQQPVQQAPYEPNYVFCSKCGTRYDANQGGCPNGCDRF